MKHFDDQKRRKPNTVTKFLAKKRPCLSRVKFSLSGGRITKMTLTRQAHPEASYGITLINKTIISINFNYARKIY